MRPLANAEGRARKTTRIARSFSVAGALGLLLLATTAHAQGAKPLTKCSRDAVPAGSVCIDKYEASVWRVPDPTGTNKGLVKKIRKGKATLKDLTKAGATQVGLAAATEYPPCARNGSGCTDLFAVSIPGVQASSIVTWFQAMAACKSAAKRLPSNAEWQAAVGGTPDPGPDDGTTTCNTDGVITLTGSRSACVSAIGAYDMVGNLHEWVADWVTRSNTCGTWAASVSPTGDTQCFAGAQTTLDPGGLLRGGSRFDDVTAGPLYIRGNARLSLIDFQIGFRCAR